MEQFDLASCPDFAPRYNIPPTSDVLVIRHKPVLGRVGQMVRWGLVPNWTKDPSIGAKMNNACAETVAEKSAFHSSFAKHRCLISANGLYEWQLVAIPIHRATTRYREYRAGAGSMLWQSNCAPD